MRFLPEHPTPNQHLLIALLIALGVIGIAGAVTYGALMAPTSESLGMLFGLLGLLKTPLKTNHYATRTNLLNASDANCEPHIADIVINSFNNVPQAAGRYPLSTFVRPIWSLQCELGTLNLRLESESDGSYFHTPSGFNRTLHTVSLSGAYTDVVKQLGFNQISLCPPKVQRTNISTPVRLSGYLNFSASGKHFLAHTAPITVTPPQPLQIPAQLNCLTPCGLNPIYANNSPVAISSFHYQGLQNINANDDTHPEVSVLTLDEITLQLKLRQVPAGSWKLIWQHDCNITQTLMLNAITVELATQINRHLQASSHPQPLFHHINFIIRHSNQTFAEEIAQLYKTTKFLTVQLTNNGFFQWHIPSSKNSKDNLQINLRGDTLTLIGNTDSIQAYLQLRLRAIFSRAMATPFSIKFTLQDFIGEMTQTFTIPIQEKRTRHSLINQQEFLQLSIVALVVSFLWLLAAHYDNIMDCLERVALTSSASLQRGAARARDSLMHASNNLQHYPSVRYASGLFGHCTRGIRHLLNAPANNPASPNYMPVSQREQGEPDTPPADDGEPNNLSP